MQSLSKDELRALLTHAKASSERDWLMILVAYWHGLRASEICGLTAGDIEDGHITVQRLKGSLKTTQPLMQHSDELLNEHALVEFIQGMHSEQRVFSVSRVTFWRRMQQYGRAANIPAHKLHPHSLKHTCAMHYIKPTGIENVRQWLGHKSISSTGEYLKVSDEAAAAAIQSAAHD